MNGLRGIVPTPAYSTSSAAMMLKPGASSGTRSFSSTCQDDEALSKVIKSEPTALNMIPTATSSSKQPPSLGSSSTAEVFTQPLPPKSAVSLQRSFKTLKSEYQPTAAMFEPKAPAPSQQQVKMEMEAVIGQIKETVVPEVKSEPQAEKTTPSSVPELKLNGFVGFDSLPYQLVDKCKSNGFRFNLLCVGETGMGKTTLVESLFNMKFEFEPCGTELTTVELRSKTAAVCEGGVNVRLRVVETAGFGDQLDKDKSAKIIVEYINAQFEAYLKEELKVRRSLAKYDDTRIHACLYFISPTGHGLKALDVTTMRELSKRVNVIPVIAKADTTCKDELVRFKKKVLSEMKANSIDIYHFPTDDETVRAENTLFNSLVPFAIIGSTDFVSKDDGRSVRARRYPWGIVEVENEDHCDFVKLRQAMLRVNEDSLHERTHKVLYERYRRDRLREMKLCDGDSRPQMMEALMLRQKEFKEEVARRKEQFEQEHEKRVERRMNELDRQEQALDIRQREIRERFSLQMKRIEAQIAEEKVRAEKANGSGKKKKHK